MIPKVIHYCWFGPKEMPELSKKCLESWKKYCPDYEIKCWNESNFDINSNQYVKEAYENKKYAFVSDYVRLYALYNEGGIYMDTDVEVLKALDNLLENRAFSGFESNERVLTGIIGSEKNMPIICDLLTDYSERHFVKTDGALDMTTNVYTITEILKNKGLMLNNQQQILEGFTLYPIDFFCPNVYDKKSKSNITDNTYTIHWFAGSWMPLYKKVRSKIYNILKSIIGFEKAKKIRDAIKKEKQI